MTDDCTQRWRQLPQRCSASALEVTKQQARVGRNVSLTFVLLKAHERIKKVTSCFFHDRAVLLLQMTAVCSSHRRQPNLNAEEEGHMISQLQCSAVQCSPDLDNTAQTN